MTSMCRRIREFHQNSIVGLIEAARGVHEVYADMSGATDDNSIGEGYTYIYIDIHAFIHIFTYIHTYILFILVLVYIHM